MSHSPSESYQHLDACMDAHAALGDVAAAYLLSTAIAVDAPTAGGRFGMPELPVLAEPYQATSTLTITNPRIIHEISSQLSPEHRAVLSLGPRLVFMATDRPPHYVAQPFPEDVATLSAAQLVSPPLTESHFLTPTYGVRVTNKQPRIGDITYSFIDGGTRVTRQTSLGVPAHLPSSNVYPPLISPLEANALASLATALFRAQYDLATLGPRERWRHKKAQY